MTTHHRQLALALLVSMLVHGILLSKVHLKMPAAAETPQSLFVELGSVTMASTVVDQPEIKPEPHPVKLNHSVKPTLTSSGPIKKQVQGAPSTKGQPTTNSLHSSETPIADDLRSRSMQMAHNEAVNPFAGLRLRVLSPQTRDNVFGPYEEAYRQKVEQVGAVNYPPPVDGHPLYGTVRVTATILKDGSLALIEILQSSGRPNLDDAARRIVQMAAPFQPFTEEMAAQADLVSITRSFNFIRAGEAIHVK